MVTLEYLRSQTAPSPAPPPSVLAAGGLAWLRWLWTPCNSAYLRCSHCASL